MVVMQSGKRNKSMPQVDAKETTTAVPAAAAETSAANAVIHAEGTTDETARHRMIAEAAYFRAARRGFAPGTELEDWLAAESDIAQALRASTKP